MTKWEFIITHPNAKEMIAAELAYAYMSALNDASNLSKDEILIASRDMELFNKAKENYLKELDSIKTDYAGVVA